MPLKLYVGNIPNDTREEELDEKFRKYGKIDSIWLARNPPGFAFVTFDKERDAEDAQREMDNQEFLGRRIRVEPSRERGGGRDRDRDRDRDRYDRRDDRGGRGRGRGPAGYNRGEFRVTISGLSSRVSWQDLKDFLRRGGEVCYADARNGEGIADFISKDEMERAIRKLDGTEFEGRKVYLEEERGKGRDSGRRDNDRRRSRSRTRSRSPRGRDRRDDDKDDKGRDDGSKRGSDDDDRRKRDDDKDDDKNSR